MTDPYVYWRAALNARPATSVAPPANPQAGFWRMEKAGNALRKTPLWQPVAIWFDERAEMQCLVDGEEAHPGIAWKFCAQHPVEEAQYHAALLAGVWHDDYAIQLKADLDRDPIEKPVKPDKIDQPRLNTPDLDGFDAIRHELEAEIETAEELLKTPVKDQETADRVGIWAKKLAEIEARAEARRVVEKEPHLTASREVDARWKPVTSRADAVAKRLKAHLQTFLMLAKAAERARAESERVKAAEAWTKVGTIDDEGERAKIVAEAQAAEEVAVARNATAGRTGMKVGLRSEKRGRIVDYDKCLAAVANHPEIREVVEKLAQRSAKGGNPLPGVEIITVEKVV